MRDFLYLEIKSNQGRDFVKKRIEWIDIARGIAIIAVIVGHSLGNYFPGKFANFIYAFHMPIFFILSGYLYHQQDSKKLMKKSFLNLIVPYIATVSLELCIIIFNRIAPNPVLAPSRAHSIKEFMVSIVYAAGADTQIGSHHIQAIGALWFLIAMFFGIQLFNQIMKLNIQKHSLIVKGLLTMLCSLVGIFSARYVTLPFALQPALLSQIFFFFGFVVKKYQLIDKFGTVLIIISMALWLIDSQFNLFGFVNAAAKNTWLAVLVGMLSSMVVIKFSIFLDRVLSFSMTLWMKKILEFWGSQSLLILCFHLIDLDMVQIWPVVVGKLSVVSYMFAIICGILYRIAFASFFAISMPKIPLLRNLYMNRQYPLKNLLKK